MKSWHPYQPAINLWVKKRGIAQADAQRQKSTAQEILKRLAQQPGVILADEVGMGKTFVALAVAASVALSDSRRRPVVVMVPPSLRDKWPLDFSVFERECLPKSFRGRLRSATADSGAEFLKLLDDPISRRASIIFLTHGAMHRGLQRGDAGGWIKLAVIQRALHRRKYLHTLRRSLYQRLGELLEMGWVQRREPEVWRRLLDRPTTEWHEILVRLGVFTQADDNPVPLAAVHALDRFPSRELDQVMKALQAVPMRSSDRYQQRINEARGELNHAVKDLWRECLRHLSSKLPLLILDEAHHLKNPQTRFASLFQDADAQQDAQAFGGELNAVFERMLFLTATPFQLGHHELCEVLNRFGSINWRGNNAPRSGPEAFAATLEQLLIRLDAAKAAALRFDSAWGKLTAQDLVIGQRCFESVEPWWAAIQAPPPTNPNVETVVDCYNETDKHMRLAEESLRPWVIRHLRTRMLAGKFNGRLRRKRLPGISIRTDDYHPSEPGLDLPVAAELPFLLAARATISSPESRPVFAEGLASSYEAFLHTRRRRREDNNGLDDDAERSEPSAITDATAYPLRRARVLASETLRDRLAVASAVTTDLQEFQLSAIKTPDTRVFSDSSHQLVGGFPFVMVA